MKSKYIIVRDMGLELPIVFNHILGHDYVAGQKIVVSAGFCHRNPDGTYVVWGKSVRLNIASRPEDAEIIAKMLEKEV
jgi:hypothetical protein